MKLASLKGGRDGRLVVVSRDLTRAADASAVAPTLQAALDDWKIAEPRLIELSEALEANRLKHIPFDPQECASPLPRARLSLQMSGSGRSGRHRTSFGCQSRRWRKDALRGSI